MPQRAYILHARSYMEDSLLLNCLTEHDGRVILVARKARSVKSRWRGLLQPFQGLWLEWRGRGQVMTLTQAESYGRTYFFQGQLLMSALYINELVDRLLQKAAPETQLLQLYSDLLLNLQTQEPLEQILRQFELALLTMLGYGLPLTYQVANGEVVLPQYYYRFHWQQGATRIADNLTHNNDCISGQTLLAMARNDWSSAQTLAEAKKLMRLIFNDIFAGRSIKSYEVFTLLD